MKLSHKKRNELYAVLHEEIVNVRIKLKLPAKDDVTLAQVEHAIWVKIKRVLGMPEYL